jgi:hypothetical protein
MQHLTDLNYSEVIDFDKDDFIMAGPGALDVSANALECTPTKRKRPT